MLFFFWRITTNALFLFQHPLGDVRKTLLKRPMTQEVINSTTLECNEFSLLLLLWLFRRSFQQWHKVGSKASAVNYLRTCSLWVIQPDHRHDFHYIVKANRSGQKWKCIFEEVDGAEGDPVRHPLSSISINIFSSFQSFERHVCRVQKADQI